MRCLICPHTSIERDDFISLDFARDKLVCKNCAFQLGAIARKQLLEHVKAFPAEPEFKGILSVEVKPFQAGVPDG